jgi:drug/metabolite transporter (DMT)-like permease
LTKDTILQLNAPPVEPFAMAFYRVLFAGLVILPTLRRHDVTIRRPMFAMVACFAAMNVLFVSALTRGTAANAILLQYTAPLWMYLAGVWWLGESADRRNSIALVMGLLGVAVIVLGGWEGEQLPLVGIALGSGVTYAAVLLFLRTLRDVSSRWLTLVNHLGAAVIMLPWIITAPSPTPAQLVVLFLFGSLQMGLAYWLVARGLRAVSAQEAGTITLLEPLLNPLWAYMIAGETPSSFTFAGGFFILSALAWRYWPRHTTERHFSPPASPSTSAIEYRPGGRPAR